MDDGHGQDPGFTGVDFAAVFTGQPTAYLVMSPDLVIRDANPAYLELLGRTREELVGAYVFDAFPPAPGSLAADGSNPLQTSFERARDTGRPDQMPLFHYEVLDRATGTSTKRAWSLISTPVLDDQGRTQLLLQRVEDVSEYVAERERLSRSPSQQELDWTGARIDGLEADLFARSQELVATVQAQEVASRRLSAMAQVVLLLAAAQTVDDVTHILSSNGLAALGADGGAIALRENSSGLVQLTLTSSLGAGTQQRFGTLALDSRLPASWAARTGETVVFQDRAAAVAWTPEMAEAIDQSGHQAWITVPLVTQGRLLGSLVAGWREARAFSPAEVELVQAFGTQCAQALDRLQALASARRDAALSRLRSQVSDALAAGADILDVVSTLPPLLVPALADACVITVLGPDGRAQDVGSWHADPLLLPHVQGYARTRLQELPGDTPFAQTVHSGQARHVTADQIAAVQMNADARAHLDALGPTRGSILPLRNRDQVLGALTLLSSADRPREPEAEATATDIADRLGAALETARLTRARTQLAEALQRSLLTAPPEPDHAQVVVRYLPAAEAARVGGDWYDAFLQPTGSTMIVIGDVAGHDTAAAAAMGQIRGLLRGIATYSSAGPAEVLRGLDASMQVLQVTPLATATVARFEQTPDEVERGVTRMVWANAGHPPPLVLHLDGTHQVLAPCKADLLLGVDPTANRTEQTITLDRGATVLLYTDGLIERRDTDLDAGMQRLTTALTELAPGATLDQLCDGLLQRLVDGRPDDDVALVAVRLHRQDRPRPSEAGPRHVPDGAPAPVHPAQ